MPSEQEIFAKATRHFEEDAVKGNFDPFDAVQDAKVIREIYDEKLGMIRFGALTYKESRECNKIEDKEERTVRTIFIMLKKAHPELTQEQVEAMPVEQVARIGSLLGNKIKSFLPKTTSP